MIIFDNFVHRWGGW